MEASDGGRVGSLRTMCFHASFPHVRCCSFAEEEEVDEEGSGGDVADREDKCSGMLWLFYYTEEERMMETYWRIITPYSSVFSKQEY